MSSDQNKKGHIGNLLKVALVVAWTEFVAVMTWGVCGHPEVLTGFA